jgi:hypothetical protein
MELIEFNDTLNEARVKINQIYSGITLLWSSSTGDYSIVMNNNSNLSNGLNSFSTGKNNFSNGQNSATIGGTGNTITGDRSVILGGRNITGNANDTVYFNNGNATSFSSSTISASSIFLNGNNVTSLFQGGTSASLWNTGATNTSIFANNNTNNISSGSHSLVSGFANSAQSQSTTIVGGQLNRISVDSDFSLIGGGNTNAILSGINSSIISGSGNTIIKTGNTVIGYSTILNGIKNTIRGSHSYIISGTGNTVNGQYSRVSFGRNNRVNKDFSEANGVGANSYLYGQASFSNGFGQQSTLLFSQTTSNNTQTEIFLGSNSERINFLSTGTTMAFKIIGLARASLVSSGSSGCTFEGRGIIVRNNAANLSVANNGNLINIFSGITNTPSTTVNIPSIYNMGFTTPPTLSISADTHNNTIKLLATGFSNLDITWSIKMELLENYFTPQETAQAGNTGVGGG